LFIQAALFSFVNLLIFSPSFRDARSADPESRDSGFDADASPRMTEGRAFALTRAPE
jgi:hypothetical protein